MVFTYFFSVSFFYQFGVGLNQIRSQCRIQLRASVGSSSEPVSDPAQSQCRIQLRASVGSSSEPVSDLEPQFLLLNLLPAVLPNYFRFNQKPVIQYWDSGKKNIFLIA